MPFKMRSLLLLVILINSVVFLSAYSDYASVSLTPTFQFLTRITGTTSTKFPVFNHAAEKHKLADNPDFLYSSLDKIVFGLDEYKFHNCTRILPSTSLYGPITSHKTGFVRTTIEAYNGRHNLIITPNDVWATIMSQFIFCVKKHPEEFTAELEDFRASLEINLDYPSSLQRAQMDKFVAEMVQEIEASWEDSPLKHWILPGFSTKKIGKVVPYTVVLTPNVDKDHPLLELPDGIPSITLEGSEKEWKGLLGLVDTLINLDGKLKKWTDLLYPVILQFVKVKEGKVDTEFWRKMVYYEKETEFGIGQVHGWITVFSVFDKDGNWIYFQQKEDTKELNKEEGIIFKNFSKWPKLPVPNISSGIVELEMSLVSGYDGERKNIVLFAGHLGTEITEGGTTLRPRLGLTGCEKS